MEKDRQIWFSYPFTFAFIAFVTCCLTALYMVFFSRVRTDVNVLYAGAFLVTGIIYFRAYREIGRRYAADPKRTETKRYKWLTSIAMLGVTGAWFWVLFVSQRLETYYPGWHMPDIPEYVRDTTTLWYAAFVGSLLFVSALERKDTEYDSEMRDMRAYALAYFVMAVAFVAFLFLREADFPEKLFSVFSFLASLIVSVLMRGIAGSRFSPMIVDEIADSISRSFPYRLGKWLLLVAPALIYAAHFLPESEGRPVYFYFSLLGYVSIVSGYVIMLWYHKPLEE